MTREERELREAVGEIGSDSGPRARRGAQHALADALLKDPELFQRLAGVTPRLRVQLPPRTAEPSQLRCLMVFDTQTKQFVGSGCYVVTSEPSIGDVEKFATVSAQFVGHGTL